jgi:hypothetical protein
VAGEAWAPGLADVARLIPRRTRDATAPGSDATLGTFTGNTTPTNVQAQAIIDSAVSDVVAATGAAPKSPPASSSIGDAMRAAAAWRAAADIELAYPIRNQDISIYAALNGRAADALASAVRAVSTGDDSPPETGPVWSAPPPWFDEFETMRFGGDLH